MKLSEDEWVKNPKTVDQVIQCLNGIYLHPSIAFYEGSKFCRQIGADLIRAAIKNLKDSGQCPRYTLALINSIDVAASDEAVQEQWRRNIDDLRILYHASPVGMKREKDLLISVSRNKSLIKAMVSALDAEKGVDDRAIEPTWLAVMCAEGSPESLAKVELLKPYLNPRMAKALDAFQGA
jgi:hypothetical protein